MKRSFSLINVLMFVAIFNLFATEKIKDVRTNPDLYYLRIEDVANSLDLLPPPPQEKSAQFLNDQVQYFQGKALRNTPRGDLAVRDARVKSGGVQQAFSQAFGTEITEENAPEIYKLVKNMREDAGDLATRAAKDFYMRQRPFAYYGEMTCNPEQQEELSSNGSYPSGHTSIGWATALVLSEINVDRQNEILQRGYEMGESRAICGYHFKSDVDAARIVAAAVVARLHANANFCKQLEKAKKEFQKLKKAGKVAPSEKYGKK